MRTAKLLASAALTALAGLTAVSGASAASVAAPAPAPAPKPPVITEQFNPPLACNQQSNLGVEGCAERQVDRADARVNAEVKVLFRFVYDNASRRDLVTAESAWLAYRTADCTSQSDMYEGGTEQPIAFLQCLAVDDQSRSADLKGFYSDLTQGRQHVPAFP
ncbi:MAG: lysozyme inhibitor LprI family protein [Acidimicrobiales bacterium]|jgi:uncharacterized protein YecT (DUF1311 family)